MALGDEQIDRVTGNLDAVMAKRISQIDEMLDDKIEKVRELLNGLSFSVNASQVKPAKPNV